jgi:outer membrane protein OmpA-like peptidoglycan-associated protein
MKKILIFFFALFNLSLGFSQKIPLLLNEEFNDNSRNWYLGDDDESSSDILNGYFYIYNKTPDYSYRFWNSFKFDTNKDFIVESKIRQVYGDKNYGYGIFIAADGLKSNYNFEITSTGYYRTSIQKNGKYDDKKWIKSNTIKPFGQYNILRIVKKGDFLYYYINGTLVDAQKFEGPFGNNYGFVLRTKMKAQIDYLKIYAYRPKINLVANPISSPKENLGTAINTKYTELMPIITADGKTLYFVRDNYPGNIGKDKDNNDIWYSTLKNGKWTKAVNIGKPLNNSGHNFVIYATPDNNTLIVNGSYTAFGEDNGNGISITHRNNDGSWSIPKDIKIDNFYNDDKYQNFAFTPDLNVMVSALMRSDDTYGKSDLYVSFRKPDGSYTEPENMGPVINTPDEEGTPFIASDGKTLYFYSKGHPGYGDADIFVSKRLDDSWKKWSKPKNLGPNINTPNWDAYFTVDAKGEYAYLVSSYNSIGKEDIFRVKLTNEQKPDPVVLIYGKVIDKKTNKPLSAKILYDDLQTNQEVGIANSNGGTGDYKIVLPYGKIYGFFAKKKGYIALSDNIDLSQIKQYTELKRNLYLVPIELDENLSLNNIFFPRGKAQLLPSSYPELDRLVEILKENPEISIEVQGYTNNIGNRDLLIQLSKKRADAVKKYLVSKGISADRITTKGFGPDKPVADNSSVEGRRKNQRVEFKITKK